MGGWSETEFTSDFLQFHNFNGMSEGITCPNITDQFAVGNNKAKLTYPVGLMSYDEFQNYGYAYPSFWLMSPDSYYKSVYKSYFEAAVDYYEYGGSHIDYTYEIRPVVSLIRDATISNGTGSETDPWIIE